jgi:hypothetical protein
MSNLKKLNLSLLITAKKTFIDEHYLKNRIVNLMSQLNQFTFDIHSIMKIKNEFILPLEEDIQKTQIVSYIDHFIERNEYHCHLWTYPSEMKYYQYLSNRFPGGYFPHVRVLLLYDESPFEHEFFLRLVQSFPLIEKLTIINQKRQQRYKSFSKLTEYSHLIDLNLVNVNDHYLEEFLCDTKTFFRQTIRLHVIAQTLLRVTKRLTRKDTRRNCAKIDNLIYFDSYQQMTSWKSSKSFQEYFPSIIDDYYVSSFPC